jgi:hypothetical protein
MDREQRQVSIVLGLAVAGLTGCAGDGGEARDGSGEAAAASVAVVHIMEPADGSTVGPDVRVVLHVEGIEIAPIADPIPGTGHHHLFLDADLTPLDQVIPAGNPMIVHKGDGSSEHVFSGLAPGPHRLIAVVANPAHVPIDPPVVDTTNFVVGN